MFSCSDHDTVGINGRDPEFETYFNSQTGEKECLGPEKKVSQSVDQAVHLMQVI